MLRALEKISANRARIIFLVDTNGHLEGSLSDGDFRRWVATQDPVDLNRPALESANTGVRVGPDQHRSGRHRDPVRRWHRPRPAGRRARPAGGGRHQPRQRGPDRPLPRRPREPRSRDQRDRQQPPGLGRLRQGARRQVARRRGRRGEVPAPRHGVALPPGLGRQRRRGPRPAVHPRPARQVQPRPRPAVRGLRPLPRHRHRGHVHALGPAQRRPAGGVGRRRLQGRLGRHDQPHPAAAHGVVRRPDGHLDRHVDRGRDPGDRRPGARHRRVVRPAALPVDVPRPVQGREPALPRAARRDRRVPGRVLRPRAGLPRAARRRGAGRQDRREALHHRPLPGGQRPQGQPAAGGVRGDGAAHPRARGVPRHRHPAVGVDRRDDEPRQPRQVAGRGHAHRGRRHHRPRRRRHQEPRPRPPAELAGPARRPHRHAHPRARRLLLRQRPRRRGARAAASTTSSGPGGCPSATTTSTR